jgi:hypothetical protein
MEPQARIELATYGLRNRCSATELLWPGRKRGACTMAFRRWQELGQIRESTFS